MRDPILLHLKVWYYLCLEVPPQYEPTGHAARCGAYHVLLEGISDEENATRMHPCALRYGYEGHGRGLHGPYVTGTWRREGGQGEERGWE